MITWVWRGTYSRKTSQAILVSSCWLVWNPGQGSLLLLGHVYREANCTLGLKDNWLGLKGTEHISALFITPESTSHKTPQLAFFLLWKTSQQTSQMWLEVWPYLEAEWRMLSQGWVGREAASGIKGDATLPFCRESQIIGQLFSSPATAGDEW